MPSKDAVFKVKIIPNASQESIVGWLGDTLKIKLTTPPQEGKANKALKQLLAKILAINQTSIIIKQGEASPNKLIQITGSSLEDVKNKI